MNRLMSDMIKRADPSQVSGLSRFFKTGPGQYGEGDYGVTVVELK